MNDIRILGKYPLYGELTTQGSKNAVLPLMAASLLNKGITILENVPIIQDVFCMVGILKNLGVNVSWEGHSMVIDASEITSDEISLDYVRGMRSSIMVLGPLVARLGHAVTYYPGGCSIGKRPVDYHVKLLRDLGITVTEENGRIEAKAAHYMGAEIWLEFPSVGATENAIMAATGALGETVIHGCAREPEILELCLFLGQIGIHIVGAGSDVIRLRGQIGQWNPRYRVCGDRIAAGTYLAAAAAAGGEILLDDAPVVYMRSTLKALCAMGCRIRTEDRRIHCAAPGSLRAIPELETGVYPGFPTDMQSVFMTLQCCAMGESRIREQIFEARLETAAELRRMGAQIRIEGNCAVVTGTGSLHGEDVTARDLRGGAALVVAGLAAEGETIIHACGHIDRGYEDITERMTDLGAKIWRKTEQTDPEVCHAAELGEVPQKGQS